MSLKNPVTPPGMFCGIDPGTVRLIAQRLNHYAIQSLLFIFFTTIYFSSLLSELNAPPYFCVLRLIIKVTVKMRAITFTVNSFWFSVQLPLELPLIGYALLSSEYIFLSHIAQFIFLYNNLRKRHTVVTTGVLVVQFISFN